MAENTTESPWLNLEEAAQYARVEVLTIQRRVREGVLRHTRLNDKPNGELRFLKEWIDNWLASRATGGTEQ